MLTSELNYPLPESAIAHHPAATREASRLLRVPRHSESFSHHTFRDLPGLLRPSDLLVLNNTRVFPARLLGTRGPGGGHIEALLLTPEGPGRWNALVRPGKKIRVGDRLVFEPGVLEAVVEAFGARGEGERLLRFSWQGDWWEVLEQVGHTPLPPYILRARRAEASPEEASADPGSPTRPARSTDPEEPADRERYQTCYAGRERGSVAAPTAGLHFSPAVFDALDGRGIERSFLDLRIGAGTFQPIKTARTEDHPMHEEYFSIPAATQQRILEARAAGRRIVAVGTTVVRALETWALAAAGEDRDARGRPLFRSDAPPPDAAPEAFAGWTRLMIEPCYRFRRVDALVTNFHLPGSSLLLLVMALAGTETIRAAYRQALEAGYRFFSYGDSMLIE